MGKKSLTRREFLAATGVAAAGMMLPGSAARAAETSRRPNVVVILADDLGYADLGCQGCKDVPTPHIDSLAANGVRFTSGYVSCPVCSPTRAGLMTGRYQERFGHEFNPGPPQTAPETFGLPLSEKTLADYLKAEGYATGLVGKWHLGYRPEYAPQKRGFDEFFGFLGGAHSYVDSLGDSANPILRGTEPVAEKAYLTDAFTREAVQFIERHKDQPFFLYLPFNAVHAPLQAPQKYLERFESIQDPKRRTFAGMLSAMDDGVGSVLEALRKTGVEEQTLVIFFSDNGGPTLSTSSRNDPLSGYKTQVLEGGIRIPFIVQWKGRIPGGKVDDRPVISLDILPTAMAAAGGKIGGDAKLDGVNLLPYLSGEKAQAPHDRLFWRFGEQSAVRAGDWKLVKQPSASPRLFNLASDVGEHQDLASTNPKKLEELQAAYGEWNAKNVEPLWGRQARRQNARARRRGNRTGRRPTERVSR